MLNYSTFLLKHLEVIDLSLTFAPVFFIVLDLRLTKVWVTAVTLFLCLYGSSLPLPHKEIPSRRSKRWGFVVLSDVWVSLMEECNLL